MNSMEYKLRNCYSKTEYQNTYGVPFTFCLYDFLAGEFLNIIECIQV